MARGSGSGNDDRMSIAFLAPARGEPVATSSIRERGQPATSFQGLHGSIPPLQTYPTPTSSIDDQDEFDYDEDPLNSSRHGHKSSPRSPRPSYTEEQKFFIMFARIVQDRSWPDIENDFARIFNQRTKGGLTSVYYRIRKNWGLEDVLKSGASQYDEEKYAVNQKAKNFSRDFLVRIQYPVS